MIAEAEVDTYLPGRAPTTGPGASDAEIAGGARAYLEAVRAELAARPDASGERVNRAHAEAIDGLLRRLYELAESRYWSEQGRADGRVSVAAVGGYGRREMALGSDVDLLFLHEEGDDALAAFVAERLQYWLWDAKVPIGGALRTVEETLALGREDTTVCTSLLSARFLCGEAALFRELGEALPQGVAADAARFVGACVEGLRERHAKYGDSLYLLQPNLKEGAGGLRDYHAAYWVARAAQPLFQTLEDFLNVGLLTAAEMEEYRSALGFLWGVRNLLHAISGRKNDQMSFEQQEELAARLGYEAPAEAAEELPVERFMRDYYRHARTVENLSGALIEQCLERVAPGPEAEQREVEEGFRLHGGALEIPHAEHLREEPVRLLRALRVAQRHDVPLARSARRTVRENLFLVDDAFRRSPAAAEAFLELLDSERRVMRSLLAMNETGLLGAYLPEWEHIVCRWQHVIYHTYTVDVHSIFLVEELRRLWRGKYESLLPHLTELVRKVEDRPALFLACLLHDVGKGRGGDHSGKGAELARRALERMGLASDRIERVVFLVRQHLLMSHVAQRRDLSDPKVIVEFARVVGDRRNLHDLHLLTFADMRASSASAWTEWKAQLLAELAERTAEFLETGGDDPARALEQIEARVATRRARARDQLRGLGVGDAKVDDFFAMMPRRYFVAHSPRQIVRHARVVFGFREEQVFATAVREMRGDFSELILYTRDLHALYANVAGCLLASDVNILASHVYTTRTGFALEVYRLSTPPGGPAERREAWERLERHLRAVLAEGQPVAERLRARRRPIGRPAPPAPKPPSVSVSNQVSDFYTVVDVAANDRLGLLYDLARTIADAGLEIYVSKAGTVLDQVADTFYVKDRFGQKLLDAARLDALREALDAVVRDPGPYADG